MPPMLPDARPTLAYSAIRRESAELRAGVAAGRDANDPAEFYAATTASNGCDGSGECPALLCAAFQGAEEDVRFLAEHGSDLNFADENGRTALHWAALRGKTDGVRALLEGGADAALRDNWTATRAA